MLIPSHHASCLKCTRQGGTLNHSQAICISSHLPPLRLITKYNDGVIFLKREVNIKYYWWIISKYINYIWNYIICIFGNYSLAFQKLCWICFYPHWIPSLASKSFILLYMQTQYAYMATIYSPNWFSSQYHGPKDSIMLCCISF